MSFRVGARIGPYEIVSPLGAGGMGEVFRARDTKLGRDVALKILPDAFATDPDRLMRFAREAKMLAALNHPNIAQVYGLEDSPADSSPGASRALVMELVEGEDLSARIGRGPLPLDEALHIARQIADGLDAAHELGVIHRDLKPSNIKVRDDGTVKVLDFGLAKALDADSSGATSEPANSPTLTSPLLTLRGVILGTAAYMSPEQAKGKPVDRRADVWAFGCVLYEMLTGQRAFGGEDTTDTIAAVVTRDPDWTKLPASTPESVRRLLRRCLSKPVKERMRSIGDAALDIAEAQRPASEMSTSGAADHRARPGTRRGLWLSVATVIALAAVAAAAWTLGRRQVTTMPAAQRAVRVSIVPSAADAIVVSGNDRDLAISPDGSKIAYVGGNGTAIIVRSLDRNEAVRIPGAGLPHNPFFSSDGASVGFSDGLSAIRKVSARGGPVETVCRITQPGVAASWHGGSIVFAQSGQVFRVSAAGGVPEPMTPPPTADQPAFFNPTFLPDGQAVLVGIVPPPARGEGGIGVIDLETRAVKRLVSFGSRPNLITGLQARFVAPDHLVYRPAMEPGNRSSSALQVIGFDLARRETVGAAVTLDEPVYTTDFGGYPDYDVAQNGTFVYMPGAATPTVRRLVWVQRDGREEDIDLPARAYTYPNFSSDGRQVAFDIRDQENDTWIWDVARNTLRRLTFDPGFDQYGIWTHDDQRLAHILGNRIFWQRADGSGQPEQLAVRPHLLAPYAFSTGDRELVFREDFPDTGHDLMMLSLDAKRTVVPLIQTRFNELNAEISPDGHWLAYQSDESGRPGIYVRPFPDVNAGRWQVSTGGRTPRWSRDGRELFFLALDGAMMSARVETAPTFVSHEPTQLFSHHNYVGGASSIGRTYDVAPDGRRFLMIKPAPPTNIAVILNWPQTLGRGSE